MANCDCEAGGKSERTEPLAKDPRWIKQLICPGSAAVLNDTLHHRILL
jgi:hypothetical protein